MKRLSTMFVALALCGICAIPIIAQEKLPAAVGNRDQASDELAPDVLLRQHAQLNERGELVGSLNNISANGKLQGLAKFPISLIQNGRLLAHAVTSPDGDFKFPGLSPGVYTLAAANAQELVVLPILISGVSSQATPISLVTASSISADRRQAVLANLYGPQTSTWPNWRLGGGAQFVAVPPSTPIFVNPAVSLQPSGALVGRLSMIGWQIATVDMEGMIVRLTRDGQTIAEAAVAADGSYVIPNVAPGSVNVLVFGPQGFAALGVQLVPAVSQAERSLTNAAENLVAAPRGPCDTLKIEIAQLHDVMVPTQLPCDCFTEPLIAEQLSPCGSPCGGIHGVDGLSGLPGGGLPGGGLPGGGGFGGGGFGGGGFGGGGGGGFGGGGGGGFGGGGLGGLGAIGGLAAAALIAGGDDDDPPFIPGPLSPNGI